MQQKPFFFILILCVIAGTVSLDSFRAYHHIRHHYCEGEHMHDQSEADCPVCLQTDIARNILRSLGLIKLAAIFALLAVMANGYVKKYGFPLSFVFSPITLKVRMNS